MSASSFMKSDGQCPCLFQACWEMTANVNVCFKLDEKWRITVHVCFKFHEKWRSVSMSVSSLWKSDGHLSMVSVRVTGTLLLILTALCMRCTVYALHCVYFVYCVLVFTVCFVSFALCILCTVHACFVLCILCTVCAMYFVYRVLCIRCTVYLYNMYFVLVYFILCMHALYCVYFALCVQCTLYNVYFAYCVLCILCTLYLYNVYFVLVYFVYFVLCILSGLHASYPVSCQTPVGKGATPAMCSSLPDFVHHRRRSAGSLGWHDVILAFDAASAVSGPGVVSLTSWH